MISAEKLNLKSAEGFLRVGFDGDQLPELVLLDLDRLQEQLTANIFDPAEYLTTRELTTFQGFKYQKRKIEWLGGRLAAKQAVLYHTGRMPSAKAMREWSISADQNGKPFLKSRSGNSPSLSISHSQGLAAAMVTDQWSCGLDIQKVSEATVRVKEKFCTAEEEGIIASINLANPPAFALTLLWAGKEALRKARGGHPLTGFTAMRLNGTVTIGEGHWLFTMQVQNNLYRILTFFYLDYAMALCVIRQS